MSNMSDVSDDNVVEETLLNSLVNLNSIQSDSAAIIRQLGVAIRELISTDRNSERNGVQRQNLVEAENLHQKRSREISLYVRIWNILRSEGCETAQSIRLQQEIWRSIGEILNSPQPQVNSQTQTDPVIIESTAVQTDPDATRIDQQSQTDQDVDNFSLILAEPRKFGRKRKVTGSVLNVPRFSPVSSPTPQSFGLWELPEKLKLEEEKNVC